MARLSTNNQEQQRQNVTATKVSGMKVVSDQRTWQSSGDYHTDPSCYDLRPCQALKLHQQITQISSHRLSTVRESQKISGSQVSYILRYADGAAAFAPRISIC